MMSATVTELPRTLEPVTRDTFADGLHETADVRLPVSIGLHANRALQRSHRRPDARVRPVASMTGLRPVQYLQVTRGSETSEESGVAPTAIVA
jgi:hypothetical protein